MSQKTFHTLSFWLIPFAMIIILWGAWVRISGSGDGCGVHWPLCQGEFFPKGSIYDSARTWIEYFHRAKSGLFGLLIILQFYLSRKLFSSDSAVRRFAGFALIFTISEGLLGAALVLFKYVADDQSIGRMIVMSLHLLNTFALLGFLTGCWYLSKNCFLNLTYDEFRENFTLNKKEILIGLLILFASIAGAWAALSTTLFPSDSLTDGLKKDLADSSHISLKVRVLHPIIGLSMIYILFVDFVGRCSKKIRNFKILIFIQILFGIFTLLFLSPTWMKLTHLLLADLVWIFYLTMMTYDDRAKK
jgi:cytochrome c oxidase assembly protein subunit 15